MLVEEYVDFDAETYTFAPFINSNQLDWKQASLQAIIDKYLCSAKSRDNDKDDDVIEVIETISN